MTIKHPKFTSYVNQRGVSEFEEFLKSLSTVESDKVIVILRTIENEGLQVAKQMLWVKKVGSNLYEVRVRISAVFIRVLYFHVENNQYVITHGFKKKSNTLPIREKKHAKRIRDSFLNRKDEE